MVSEAVHSMSRIQLMTAHMTTATVKGHETLPDTKLALWGPLVPSFLALEAGKWPGRSWDGREFEATSIDDLNKGRQLAGGYYCVVMASRVTLIGK